MRSWPLGIVDRALVERLADPLRDAAMDLAVKQDRIHRRAEIVDDDVVGDGGDAGLGVDLDLGDMGAVRVGRLGLLEVVVEGGEQRRGPSPPARARRG